jgi:hypothetical protein
MIEAVKLKVFYHIFNRGEILLKRVDHACKINAVYFWIIISKYKYISIFTGRIAQTDQIRIIAGFAEKKRNYF